MQPDMGSRRWMIDGLFRIKRQETLVAAKKRVVNQDKTGRNGCRSKKNVWLTRIKRQETRCRSKKEGWLTRTALVGRPPQGKKKTYTPFFFKIIKKTGSNPRDLAA